MTKLKRTPLNLTQYYPERDLFDAPGKRSASNTYVEKLLEMANEYGKKEQVVEESLKLIFGTPTEIQKKAFSEQVNNSDGKICGPAYAVIRDLTQEACGLEKNQFFTDLNFRVLQNTEWKYVLGGNLLGVDTVYASAHKTTANFTDAITTFPQAQFSPIGEDKIKMQEHFKGGHIGYQFRWHYNSHYLEDVASYCSNSLEDLLYDDALQTAIMDCTISRAFSAGSREKSQGVIIDDNLREMSAKIAKRARKGDFNVEDLIYTANIIVPKTSTFKRLFSPLFFPLKTLRNRKHLDNLRLQLNDKHELLETGLLEQQRVARYNISVGSRLGEVVDMARSISKEYDVNVKKMLARSQTPKQVPKISVPRYDSLLTEGERKKWSLLFSPTHLLETQGRIIKYRTAQAEIEDEISRLKSLVEDQEVEAQDYRKALVSATGVVVRNSKHTREHSQPQVLLKILQKADGYTAYHSIQTALSYLSILDFSKKARDLDWFKNKPGHLEMAIKFAKNSREDIIFGGLLHDVGKIGDAIFGDTKRLFSKEEKRTIARQHTSLGGDILHNAGTNWFSESLARLHHERPDGKGYEEYITEQIPNHVVLFSPGDVYSSVRTRSYNRPEPLNHRGAVDEISSYRGTQFVAPAMDIFLEAINNNSLFVDLFEEISDAYFSKNLSPDKEKELFDRVLSVDFK